MTREEAYKKLEKLFPINRYSHELFSEWNHDTFEDEVTRIFLSGDSFPGGITYAELHKISEEFGTDKINLIPRQEGYRYSSYTYDPSVPEHVEIIL